MTRSASARASLASLVLLPLAACGGAVGPGNVVGKDALAKQANIRASCDAAERGHDDPYTVEWEATDVASFEAEAARDTVFVRYHGCDIDVLPGVQRSAAVYRDELAAYGISTGEDGVGVSGAIREPRSSVSRWRWLRATSSPSFRRCSKRPRSSTRTGRSQRCR